ncbi:hypothetical protein EC991_005424 [Linnemannia zychae]|nr:hypothetical protein EC991_005424 [Linnemannia zychae]
MPRLEDCAIACGELEEEEEEEEEKEGSIVVNFVPGATIVVVPEENAALAEAADLGRRVDLEDVEREDESA